MAAGTPQTRRERPTIGVLAGWQLYERTTTNWFLEALLEGVMSGARELDCDVLLACGVGSSIVGPSDLRPAWPEARDDTSYVPVGGWNTDAIVVLSPLRTAGRREYVRRLQASGHPVVFVGAGDGRPSVEVDSALGIRHALEHLRGHGHTRVAFVAGDPLDGGDSLLRLAAFRRLAPELGFEEDGELVAHGCHTEAGGYQALQRILERGRAFTALVASNDASAVGAMHALAEAGLEVPADVAVVGFDDHLVASAHVPPLTTVRYPLAEAGRRAVERLVDGILGGRELPERIAIPPVLIGRRSCGCLPRDDGGREAWIEPDAAGGASGRVAAQMAEAARRAGSRLKRPEATAVCRRLVAGLQASLGERSSAAFDAALMQLLQRLESAGDHAHRWQSALTRLRCALPALLGGTADAASEAEDLLHFARLALSESAERDAPRQRLLDSERAERVSALSVPLQSVQDEEQVFRLLAEHAPALGARPVCLALYEAEGDDPVAWSRVRLLDRAATASGFSRLRTREVLPGALRPAEVSRCLAVLPLVLQERTLGFVAFDVTTLDACAAITRPLAVALESVRLQAAVRALTVTDELTGLHNRRFFESELRREVERSRRYRRDVALVMMDLDHFKLYNDSFGHRAGDEALRRVAVQLLEAVHRQADVVMRYGGEEFVVLLAETDAEGARRVAERLREAVERCPGLMSPLTISAGVSVLRAADGDPDAEVLVLRADAALYRAKAEGRNRVCGDVPAAGALRGILP